MQTLASSFALGLALIAGFAATAQAQTKIRMVLNWKYEGPQGMFFLADDRGYFKQEGLEITFDQGNGSGAAVPQVANGAYDAGFGDINALIEREAWGGYRTEFYATYDYRALYKQEQAKNP